MATEIVVESESADGRTSRVRITSDVDVEDQKWFCEKAGGVPVAAGGTIEWVFNGDLRVGDQPVIRFERQDPLSSQQPSGNRIVGTIHRDVEDLFRYQVEVKRGGRTIPLQCIGASMGGVKVSQPPVGR